MSDRTFCLVPDCDEQPYPSELLCETHLKEEIRREREKGDDDGAEYGDPRDARDERRHG